MSKQYYTLRIKEQCLGGITKRFEISYTASRHQSIIDVIKKHQHYDESPYSIEAIAKHDRPISIEGYGY